MIIDIFKGILDIPVPFNMIVLIVLFGCIAGTIGAIAKEIRKYACHSQDIAFKRELVERGLVGDEIERIVAAKPPVTEGPMTIGNYFAGSDPAQAIKM